MLVLDFIDFDTICRLCLSKSDKLLPIFGYGSNVRDRIEDFTSLKLAVSDGLPNTLCMECRTKLDLFKEFQDQCLRSDTVLREFVNSQQTAISADLQPKADWKGELRERKEPSEDEAVVQVTTKEEALLESSADEEDEATWNGEMDASETTTDLSKPSAVISNNKFKDTAYSQQNSGSVKHKNSIKDSPDINGLTSTDRCQDTTEDNQYAWPGSLSDEEPDQSNSSEVVKNCKSSSSNTIRNSKKRKQNSYECEFCGRTFPRSNHLAQHELTHTKEKPFHCSYCQKGFWYKNSLIGHIKQNHTGDVNYTCEECGRGFFQRSEYMRHKPTHSQETPFKCDECDMSFKLMKNLKRHQKVHTGARTHTCQYCGKSFRMLQTLRVHLILHSGEKPYKCTHCGRGFSQSAPLKAHVRMHTGEKPYVCNVCGDSFPTGNALKAHTFKHTGIHANSCKDCSMLFKRKRDLVEHWNEIHGGAPTDPIKVPPQLPPMERSSEASHQKTLSLVGQPIPPPKPLTQPALSLPTPPTIQEPSQFDDMDELIIGGSLDPLDDDDSLSSNPSTHQILLNPLPSVLEISHTASQHLLQSSLVKSDSEDLLMSPDGLSFA